MLQQLKAAGVAGDNASDALTDGDKQQLLSHLQASHGSGAKKITLTKRSTSEIKQADSSGRARTIQVEVRKKRTFVKRDEAAEGASDPLPLRLPRSSARGVGARISGIGAPRREARRQAEMIGREEEELAQQRREREERELVQQREREAEERAAAYAAAEAAKIVEANRAKQEASREQAAGQIARAEAQLAARAKAEEESKARAAEEAERAKDLEDRRRKALAEAEAIRAMMAAPKKVLVAKKPEEPKPVAKPAAPAAADAKKTTLHKPAGTTAGGAGARACRRRQGSQVRQALLELGRRWQEEGNQDPWRQLRWRGRPFQLARRPAWRPSWQ